MRWLLVLWVAIGMALPAGAAPLKAVDTLSTQAVLQWMTGYRRAPDPAGVPRAMKALSDLGAFHDTEHAGTYIGFLAGVLAANPQRAPALIGRSLAMRRDDRWVVLRAIAYSGIPGWQQQLRRIAPDVPSRQAMIEAYLSGRLPTLAQFRVPPEAGMMDRMRAGLHLDAVFGAPEKTVTLEPSADVLDLLWGYFFATGRYQPVMHMIALLPWSVDHNDVERLVIGSMAKFTLASNALHQPDLLAMLKRLRARPGQPRAVTVPLDEVIKAADTVQVGPVRAEALAAINELRAKGPAYKRTASWWSYLGQTAIAGGCLAAATAGVVAAGLPCVVGGAASSAIMNFLANAP